MSQANQYIRKQAAKWFARMQNVASDHPDRSQFEAWLMQNPTHAREYAKIAATWDDFDSSPQLAALADAMQHKKSAQQEKRKNIINKVAAITLVFFMSLFGFQAWQTWQAQPLMQLAKTTQIGEIAQQALSDGSTITLNANSEIEVIYYRDKRLVKLKRGEAIFEVAKNAERPFIVDSQIARITVLGTRFLVNRLSERVVVAVDHGKVKVEAIDQVGNRLFEPILLTNGLMAEVQTNAAPRHLTSSAGDAFSFTQGKLTFEEASLAEVAETLSRYRTKPVVAINSSGKQAHITAMLNISETESFIRTLPKITAVSVQQTESQTQLISKE